MPVVLHVPEQLVLFNPFEVSQNPEEVQLLKMKMMRLFEEG